MIGEAGAEETWLGGIGGTLLRIVHQPDVPDARVEGLWLRDGDRTSWLSRGIAFAPAPWPLLPTYFVDVEDCRFTGLWSGILGVRARLIDTEFESCGTGLDADTLSEIDFEIHDSTFRSCGSACSIGLFYSPGGDAHFERCLVEGCSSVMSSWTSGHGSGGEYVGMTAEGCVFRENANCVYFGVPNFPVSYSWSAYNTTIDGMGTAASPGDHGYLRNCISIGHTVSDATASASHCFFGDGSFAGQDGNFTGPDPGFVDRASGDDRLGFDSPCVDRGTGSPLQAEYRGLPRTVDGDLNGHARRDLGAHELQPLIAPTGIGIGESYRLELNGPVGEPYQVFFSRNGLHTGGTSTPFGTYWLPPSTSTRIHLGTYPAGGPATVPLSIPNAPGLVGSMFTFQALPRVPSSPAGAVWTPSVVMDVTPSSSSARSTSTSTDLRRSAGRGSHLGPLGRLRLIHRFLRGGRAVYRTVTWPGFLGCLSGVAPGRLAVTLNSVWSAEPKRIAIPWTFLLRRVLESASGFAVVERTPTRTALRQAEGGRVVVANEYLALGVPGGGAAGELAATSGGRYGRACELLALEPASLPGEAFAVLEDPRVRMDMTVQQMVLHAATGGCDVRACP